MLGIAGNFGNDIKDFINVFGLKVSPNNFGSGCAKRSYKTQYFYEDSVNIKLVVLNDYIIFIYTAELADMFKIYKHTENTVFVPLQGHPVLQLIFCKKK